ncbi:MULTISPECIES: acetaldehyde dehydrogenase (acetylating) [Peribacillus]|uniref:acetaldehyde dehydrogenase (acetylating) n=1 Tax=Peribacillus TaxID=2675229 RepID=UPI001070E8F5|nr:acetaldehyde dehydrogenase (acetylating) [Peribacillus frigoritolerans]MEC0300203.1 acetaldehyde dehydrogenase (acetylating) [Peribacillus castrilensis]MEC0345063.1 acetaldehyde dehydrogenase (acetylating) [Peribacillus castrilensis]TFH62432.1 acetaldehyde dehydrogenase (acetylating) [Peribacillus frigoritolerans]
MKKLKVGIIGSGNIGTDLMMKIHRSDVLEMSVMIGIDTESEGLKKARMHGHQAINNGMEGFLERPELADILFDATSAKAHVFHCEALKRMNKKLIDLTPAAIGPFVVPSVNLTENLNEEVVNMITCGGQATIPIVHAISQVAQVEYAEIIATISSKSAGPGTRANIDEFTQTTARALEKVGGAAKGKAIILLNPAEPPLIMRDTIHCLLQSDSFDVKAITASINEMAEKVSEYVPGYRLKTEPIFEGRQITVLLEVEGLGDFLPVYAGNLDIMTASAVKVGEEIAKSQFEQYV